MSFEYSDADFAIGCKEVVMVFISVRYRILAMYEEFAFLHNLVNTWYRC